MSNTNNLEVYKKRIQVLLELFNSNDPNWISKRQWTDEMVHFQLGENFFLTFISAEDGNKEMYAFQQSVIVPWLDTFRGNNKLTEEEEDKETEMVLSKSYLLGVEIDTAEEDDAEEELKVLDYAWWDVMLDIIYPTETEVNKMLLEKKAAKFSEEMGDVE